MLIAMLDGLCHRHHRRDHPPGAPAFARQHPLAIGSHEDGYIPTPAIAEPREGAMVGSLDGGSHCSLNESLV
jgi:hypothetical protein